jgi:acyl-CoA synthetase (AMP-forming)/AMP-acid ligase II
MNRSRSEWDHLEAAERARLLLRAGVPVVGTEITTDADGEVLARSNTVLTSYWENPTATEDALGSGWFRTGDGGSIDDGGYVTITDRLKDVIITGGENVSSIEVEDAILHHPHVTEVAVIGIPDDKWGELVTALVVTDGSEVTEESITAMVREHIAGYKVPKRIEFRDELPRTATGKLQKAKLREPYWEGVERKVH